MRMFGVPTEYCSGGRQGDTGPARNHCIVAKDNTVRCSLSCSPFRLLSRSLNFHTLEQMSFDMSALSDPETIIAGAPRLNLSHIQNGDSEKLHWHMMRSEMIYTVQLVN